MNKLEELRTKLEQARKELNEKGYHYDSEMGIYLADIIISAKSRRHGFGKAGLLLLCQTAQKEKIPELYDNIAIDNPGISLFLQCGFYEDYRTEEIIMLRKKL